MGDLVEFGPRSTAETLKCQELYSAYRAAREKAELSQKWDDDLAARKAWADWAEEFCFSSRRTQRQ